MKTVMIDEPFKIHVGETDMPKPGEGEALLKVMYGGICGADRSFLHRDGLYDLTGDGVGIACSAFIRKRGKVCEYCHLL